MSKIVKAENTEVAIFDASKIVIKKKLVIPGVKLDKMKEGDALFFEALGEIRYTTQTDTATGEIKLDSKGEPEMLPLLEVKVLGAVSINPKGLPVTGQEGQIVLAAIVYRALHDCEVIAPLTGRRFGMKKGESLGTGKATLWEVVEIE